jgi:hypothetical protein
MTKEIPAQAERVLRAIVIMRGHRVILDSDLPVLYGVETRRLNEQVRRAHPGPLSDRSRRTARERGAIPRHALDASALEASARAGAPARNVKR